MSSLQPDEIVIRFDRRGEFDIQPWSHMSLDELEALTGLVEAIKVFVSKFQAAGV